MRPPELHTAELVIRLILATGLGAVVGFEREWRDRTAGLRTHMLVCLGSAAFTIISAYGFREWYPAIANDIRPNVVGDPTRIAAQIVTGIGFLGAGAIFRSDDGVRGLTTAASLWVMAAIGIAAGAGYYELAVVCTLLILIVLIALRQVSGRIKEINHEAHASFQLTVDGTKTISTIFEKLIETDSIISHFEAVDTEKDTEGKRQISFQLQLATGVNVGEIIDKMIKIDGVHSASTTT